MDHFNKRGCTGSTSYKPGRTQFRKSIAPIAKETKTKANEKCRSVGWTRGDFNVEEFQSPTETLDIENRLETGPAERRNFCLDSSLAAKRSQKRLVDPNSLPNACTHTHSASLNGCVLQLAG